MSEECIPNLDLFQAIGYLRGALRHNECIVGPWRSGSALRSGRRGRGFKSLRPDQKTTCLCQVIFCF